MKRRHLNLPMSSLRGNARSELETFDLMAINGLNTDIPRERDHDELTILRRNFAPVCRVRLDPKSIAHEVDEDGEDIFRVDTEFMPRPEMRRLADTYRHLKPRFF